MSRQASRSRRPGRPSQQAAEAAASRDALLDAALHCFVRDGIRSTTLRAIAQQAQVTPAMLHYYFGDKPKLIEVVIEERLLPALDGPRAALAGAGDDPRRLLRGFVTAALALGRTHPWLPPLWVREVLSEGGELRPLLIERIAPLLPRVLADRFADWQQRGAIKPLLDPRLLVVSLIGLTIFPLASAPIWRQIFAADDVDDARLGEHVIALLEAGVLNDVH